MQKNFLLWIIFFVLIGTSCVRKANDILGFSLNTPNVTDENIRSSALTSLFSTQEDAQPEAKSYLPWVSRAKANPQIWQPQPGLSWQWDLSSERPEIFPEVQVYDVDLYTDQEVLNQLKQRGVKLICYLSVGSWEEWRPDANQFPPEVLGKDYEGWPGEKWLDIRQIDKLAPIMQARLNTCAAKGFDAVEPDNMEVSTNDSGFPITAEDERRYALWLADQAHQRRLAIGMKNTAHLVDELLPYFEYILTEDCFAQGWCEQACPFIESGKPVFAAEYSDEWTVAQFQAQVCPQAAAWNFSAILKNRSLDAWLEICQNSRGGR